MKIFIIKIEVLFFDGISTTCPRASCSFTWFFEKMKKMVFSLENFFSKTEIYAKKNKNST
jgi:hypothetical protein